MQVKPAGVLLLMCVCAVLALAACPKQPAGTGSTTSDGASTAGQTSASGIGNDEYPIARTLRPYSDVHASVKQAWFLVETAYVVIRSKYRDANKLLESSNAADKDKGSKLKAAVTEEVQKNIFGVNDKVEQLFKDAIKAEPDNPLNMVSYAYYLKARQRFKADGASIETESEALQLMDDAIKIWPDEANFYLVKVHIMTAPHQCNDWFRARALEDIAISRRLPEIRELLAKAEQYDPTNHYVNYYLALLLAQYTPPTEFATVKDEIMRQIRAGNKKPRGYFFFPPPLRPYYGEAKAIELFDAETEAKYVDHWLLFGHYDPQIIGTMVDGLLPTMKWPQDKQDVGELMFMLYQFGRTKPYDRSMFTLQLKVLDYYLRAQESGSPESLKIAEALRFLNEQYRTVANYFYGAKVIPDATLADLRGLQELEFRRARQMYLKVQIQPAEAAYLKRAGEILGLNFPLPADPQEW